jgi:hypothetical protein
VPLLSSGIRPDLMPAASALFRPVRLQGWLRVGTTVAKQVVPLLSELRCEHALNDAETRHERVATDQPSSSRQGSIVGSGRRPSKGSPRPPHKTARAVFLQAAFVMRSGRASETLLPPSDRTPLIRAPEELEAAA